MDDSRRAHSLATVPVRCRVSETERQRRACGKEREELSPNYSEGQSPDVRRSTVQPIKAERSQRPSFTPEGHRHQYVSGSEHVSLREDQSRERNGRREGPKKSEGSIVKREQPSSPSSGDDSSDDGEGHNPGRWGDGRRRSDKNRRRRSGGRSSDNEESRSKSRRRSSTNQKRLLKPEKFDGRTSFETFMYMFENCATYNQWKEKDKVAHLLWSLTGQAAQLLWDTGEAGYEELVEKLRGRFGGKGIEEKFQTELRCRRRGKGESL